MSKCTLCYLNEELLDFYKYKDILNNSLPIININLTNIKSKIKNLYENPRKIYNQGKKSKSFVKNYHSYEYIGKKFDSINKRVLKVKQIS